MRRRDVTCRYRWWATSPSNWNQVCSGSLAVAALALADVPRYAALATQNFDGAVAALPVSVDYWQPHGVWWEGDTYAGCVRRVRRVACAWHA